MDTGQPGLHGPVVACLVEVDLKQDPEAATTRLQLMEAPIASEMTTKLGCATLRCA